MSFLSGGYLLSLFLLIIVYYLTDKSRRYIVLLLFDILFILLLGYQGFIFFLFTAITTYFCGRYVSLNKGKKAKVVLSMTILTNLFVMLILRLPFVTGSYSFIVPVGISFYTLQVIAYMVDCYKDVISYEKSFLKYFLFISFFPQILQGPIPRYKDLSPYLYTGKDVDTDSLKRGIYMLAYGYFLKLVIADRCKIPVDIIFNDYKSFSGLYFLLAGVLYSLQLYADFSGCVYIAKGSAMMFSIPLPENFNQPYFASSIKDFWRRWHISLSSFLKDYVYIPLGGNRKGKIRKYINILITFLISGIWHGRGNHFIIWGLIHGFYQVLGDIFTPVKAFFAKYFDLNRESLGKRILCALFTDFLAMIAWIFFRAGSIKQGIYIVTGIFKDFNPWIFFTGEFTALGLHPKEWTLVFTGVILMIFIGILREKKIRVLTVFLNQPNLFKVLCLMFMIFLILITGIYGPGYDANQFIYGGF